MKSKYADLKNGINLEKIKEAADCIKNGELVLFPTETVYGIGANALDEKAVSKIFKAKGRAGDNPLIVHISNLNMLENLVQNIGETEKKLMKNFWPGPLTIILNKKECIPYNVTAGLETVGIRFPSNMIAQDLIEFSELPIAAPSANISGRPSGTNVEDIFKELSDKVNYIIDGGQCEIGVESTVVRVVDGVPHILRPGKITAEQIKKVAGNVIVDKHILGDLSANEPILSPGMKYKHYAPNSKCMLIYSKENGKMVDYINETTKKYKNPLIVCHTKNLKSYNSNNIIDMGETLEEVTKNIFKILRKVDSYNPDIVLIEGVQKDGLGLAVMNRLIRACEHNYIEL